MKYSKFNVRALTRSRAGFTLFEVVLAMAIATSIIFVIAAFRRNLDQLQNFTSQKLQSRQDIDQTIQIMTAEIRSAGPSSAGAYPIETATSTSFIFYSDIDKDGLFERVRYSLGTSTIVKGVVHPSGNPLTYATSTEVVTTVVDNVVTTSSPALFAYYDLNYTGSQAPMTFPITVSQVRIVQFSFSANVNTSSSYSSEFFSQLVDIRNVRSN